MGNLTLTLACMPWDHVLPLFKGRVSTQGLDIIVVALNRPADIFWRMLRFEEFDASEMSLSSYLRAKEAGKPFIAIPVFTSRKFRHSFVFVNKESGIERPEDLAGKRMGVPEYQLTAALWIRGFLKDDYGLDPRQLNWFYEREERTPFSPPPGLSITKIPTGKSLEAMLVHREIDALITALPSQEILSSDRVRRLFPDFKKVEMDYFNRTEIFPIMHTVILRQDLYNRHPWVANRLMDAFDEAKRIYLEQRNLEALHSSLVWIEAYLHEEACVFGKDPFPNGLAANQRAIETLIRYSFEQGLIKEPLPVEKLFAPNTLGR